MLFNICLLIFINTFFYTIHALPYARHRRQATQIVTEGGLPYEGWGGSSHNPSGGSPGAYYGSGHDPNYGNIAPIQNDVGTGIHVLNYYNHNGATGIHQNWNQVQQQYSLNNNNRWQSPNTNNYYNRPYNRYPPGSQGWYATGGNYWYSAGQSLVPYTFGLVISILISIIHTY